MKIFIYGGTGYIGTSLICGLGERHQFFIATRKKTKNFIYNAQLFDENKDSKIIKKKLKQADLIIFANGPSYKDSLKNLYKYVRYLNIQIENIIKLKKKKN